MKNNIFLLGMFSFLTLSSCNNNNKEVESSTTPAPETVVVEQPTPVKHAPEQPTPETEGTTIKMNDNGVSYENKNDGKSSNVNISGDSTSIEIKRPK